MGIFCFHVIFFLKHQTKAMNLIYSKEMLKLVLKDELLYVAMRNCVLFQGPERSSTSSLLRVHQAPHGFGEHNITCWVNVA